VSIFAVFIVLNSLPPLIAWREGEKEARSKLMVGDLKAKFIG